MSKFPVGLFAIVYCLLPGSAFAQQDRFSPIEILPLADGSFIRFERFSGALLRLKEGRQTSGEVAEGNDDRTTDGRCHVERRIAAARGSR